MAHILAREHGKGRGEGRDGLRERRLDMGQELGRIRRNVSRGITGLDQGEAPLD